MVVHTCISNTEEAEAGESCKFQANHNYQEKLYLKQTNKKE